MPKCDRLDNTCGVSIYVTSQLEVIWPASVEFPHKIMSSYEITWWKLLPMILYHLLPVLHHNIYPDRSFLFLPPSVPSHSSRGLDQEIPVYADPVPRSCFLASDPRPGWHLLGCTTLNLIGIVQMETKKSIEGFYIWNSREGNFRIKICEMSFWKG